MCSGVPGGSSSVKEEPTTKFIHTRPGESTSPKLFVSNGPEDGYDLTFPSLAEFEEWRRQEEDTHTVEFVKGDTHGSRTNPPRFKEHVKLVCARHTRRGRKQYVKKHPERTRKTPSRKIDGVGCPATICYKTYVETEVVRVMYNPEHSHPIGLENLPFTRKGQKALRTKAIPRMPATSVTSTSEDESGASTSVRSPTVSVHTIHSSMGPDLFGLSSPLAQRARELNDAEIVGRPHARPTYAGPLDHQPSHDYHSPIRASRLDSEPAVPHESSLAFELPPLQLPQVPTAQDRWERLAVLFRSVHTHALTFDYPEDSIGALEGMLVRMYLESPLVGGIVRDETTLGTAELGMGSELGMSGIGNGLGDLDAMGIIGDGSIGMPSHQHPQLSMSHLHHNA